MKLPRQRQSNSRLRTLRRSNLPWILGLGFTMLLLLPLRGWAQASYFVPLALADQPELIVINLESKPVAIQVREPMTAKHEPLALQMVVEPRQSLRIPLTPFRVMDHALVSALENPSQIRVYFVDALRSQKTLLELLPIRSAVWSEPTSPNQKRALNLRQRESSSEDVGLFNSSPLSQVAKLEVITETSTTGRTQQIEIPPFGFVRVASQLQLGQSLRVRFPIAGYAYRLASDGSINSLQPEADSAPDRAPSVSPEEYVFEIAHRRRAISFLVRTDSLEIARQARELIANPDSNSKLITAVVALGSGVEVNRDLRSLFRTPWSWHVSKWYGFADFGHINCDGGAEKLEELLLAWTQQQPAAICFWNYRVVREITAEVSQRRPAHVSP